MFDELKSDKRGVPGFVYHGCRRTKFCKRRQKLQERKIEMFPRCSLPPRVIPLPHTRHFGLARSGGMKGVNTVRSGCRLANSVTTGSTRSIHGVGHGPSVEKSRCISTQR